MQGLACALAFKTLLEYNLVQGTVVLFGTPAEETTSGKINFVKEGILQNTVDYSMMLVSYIFKHTSALLLNNYILAPFC